MKPSQSIIIRCSNCRTKNRIPYEKRESSGKCGRCGRPLDTRGVFTPGAIMVNDRDFESQVLQAPVPVLMFCWATWCPSCQAMMPVIDDMAADWQGKIRVAKVNVDQSPMIAARFQIRSVPFLFLFDNGQLQESMVGGLPRDEIVLRVAKYLY